ncbi:MAG: hypothetical protein AAFQ17_00420, partial [Pseudomonadota bacterium]
HPQHDRRGLFLFWSRYQRGHAGQRGSCGPCAKGARQLLEGKTVRKVIVVPGQIVNIVAN